MLAVPGQEEPHGGVKAKPYGMGCIIHPNGWVSMGYFKDGEIMKPWTYFNSIQTDVEEFDK